jgi:MYXO-CTERM domain-containing protein
MRILTSSLSIGLCLSAFSGAAVAQSECAADADCAEGMVCEVVGSSGCAGAACPDGEPDCVSEPVDCETEEFTACMPGPCESDADCGADMVCHTYEWESCDGSAGVSCDADGNCEEMEVESNCTSGSSSECIYRWQEPCSADADCGGGFTCVTVESVCDCGGAAVGSGDGAESGGGMDPSTDGDMAPPSDFVAPPMDAGTGGMEPPPETTDCDCGGEYSYCQADEIPCETADECPSGWSCEAPPSGCGDVPMESAPPGDDVDPPQEALPDDAPMAVDAGAPEQELLPPDERPACEPVDAPSQCVPPGGGFDGPGRPVSDGSGTVDPDTGEAGGGEDLPEPPVDEEEPAIDDGEDDLGGDDDSAEGEDDDAAGDDDAEGGDDDVTEDDEPAADAGAEDEDDQELEGTSDADSGDDGGCSVAQAPTKTSSAAWLAALLGLSLLRRRR